MTEQEFYRNILAINYANLMANLENVSINSEILRRSKTTDDKIVYLLTKILEEIRHDNSA